MFLSFLKSMQTKSQDAQNPGLWVNGNRMPVQEAMGGITKPLTNKVINKDAEFTNPDTGKALGDAYMSRWQERRDDEDKGINHENETPVDYTERKHEEEEDFVGPPSKLSGHNLYTKNQLVQEELTKDEIARRDKVATDLFNRFGNTEKINYTREPKRKAGTSPGGTYTSESGRTATTATPLKKRADTPGSNKPKSLSDQKKKPLQEENINHPVGLPLITFTNSVKKGFPNASVEERGKMVDDMMKAWNNRNKSKANKPKSKSAPMQENTNRSMFLTHLQGMQTKSQDAQNPGLWVNGNRMPMQEAVKPVDQNANREVTPDEADIHADAAAAGTSKNRLGSEIGHHPHDANNDGAVVPEERQTTAKQGAAAANVSSDSWASMTAKNISGQAPKYSTGDSDAY